MSQPLLSIDLQSDLLTAVLLNGEKPQLVLHSTVVVLVGKEPKEVVQELTESLNCSGYRCYLSLGASFFLFRNLDLPFSDRKSIEKILPLELEETLAGSIDTMVLDTIVNPGEGKEVEVIVAMIENELLSTWYTAFQEAEIFPTRIAVSGMSSIAEILNNGQPPEEFVFLSMRMEDAALFIISGKRLQLVRSLPFKALGFDAKPDSHFAFNRESGELVFEGLEHTGEAYHDLALAVRQTLAPMPLNTSLDQMPLYIEGSGILTPAATSWVEEVFAMPCLICGKGGVLPPPLQLPKKTEAHVAYLTSCLSLALQSEKSWLDFEFCKGTYAPVDSMAKFRLMVKTVAAVCAVSLVVSITYLVYDNGKMKTELNVLRDDTRKIFTETLPSVKRIVDPVQQLGVAIESIKQSSGEGETSGLPFTALHLLREISVKIPASLDVRLSRMVYEAKGLRLIGRTDTFNTVDSMKKSLESSADVVSVTISSANMNPKDSTIRFELKIDLEAAKK